MTQQEMMEDSTQYCCYCGGEKVRFQCCGENHFQTFAQMSADEQDEFLDNEECAPLYTSTQPQKPWVGLTQIDVDSWDLPDRPTVFEFAQFIEAKLKEKNNG
jgi:hypothetical protein